MLSSIFKKKLKHTKIAFDKYKKYVQFTFILIFIIFLIKITDTNQLFKILKEIKIEYILIALLIFLNSIFLVSLRSFILIKKFTSFKFMEFFKISVYGLTANSITFTSFANDIFKYYSIKKRIDAFNSFALVLFDKLITFYFKIFYLIFLFNVANIFLINFYTKYILTISVIIIILFIYLFLNFKNIFTFILKKKLIKKKKYLFICSNFDYVSKKIFLFITINFFVLINLTLIYICIFKSLMLDDFILSIILINPILETISQLSVILPGIRETITILTLKLMNIDLQIGILAAFLYSFLTYLSLLIYNILIFIFFSNK